MATKTQSKKSGRATVRENRPRDLWTRKAPPLHFGREQFRFRLYRTARRLPALDIDPWIEHANWQRDGGTRTGEINFRRPLGPHTASMLSAGDEVRCYVAVWGPTGQWKELWRMKVATPNHQIADGLMSVSLETKIKPLTRSKVAWKFVKNKRHKRGWTAREITLHVCRRFNIPVGELPKATHRISSLVEKSASPYDVIVRAWKKEREHTGRRFDVDVSTGKLSVREMREPRFKLVLGAGIMDATIEQTITGVASAVVATATRKASGEKATKLRVKVVDRGRRRRYGYIVKTLKAPRGIDSKAELRRWAKKRLARMHRQRKTLSFTHPGLPYIDRGTPLRLRLPEADFDELVFVTAVRHDLSAGSYTMEVTIGFSDPWRDKRKERVKRKKAEAARRRGRRGRGDHSAPKPKRARTRSHA